MLLLLLHFASFFFLIIFILGKHVIGNSISLMLSGIQVFYGYLSQDSKYKFQKTESRSLEESQYIYAVFNTRVSFQGMNPYVKVQ